MNLQFIDVNCLWTHLRSDDLGKTKVDLFVILGKPYCMCLLPERCMVLLKLPKIIACRSDCILYFGLRYEHCNLV